MKTKGIYILYRVLQAFGLPVLLSYFLGRSVRNRAYGRSLPERFGFLPRSYKQTTAGAIWLHAVSVGEVLACQELLRRLRAEFPRSRIFVSTGTLAGRATAGQKLAEIADGVFYAPVDYVFAVRRVLRTLRPAVVLVAETEIWPNLFREVKRTGAGLAVVNGRISDRAYPRDLRYRWFFRHVLPAVDAVLAQSEEMAARFVALGAPAERVSNAGNVKYDFEAKAATAGSPVARWLERVRPGKVWIAASTADEAEEGAVIAAFAWQRGDLALILAPRKPERFDAASRHLEGAGIAHARRSRIGPDSRERVLLLDSIGELGGLFGLADVVFMGGTLAERGGHNILEPAFFGKPVIVGPHMENFQEIADQFRAAEAVVEIPGAAALADAVERLLAEPGETGARGRVCAEARRGATARVVAEVHRLYSLPRYLPMQPWYAIRWLLSEVWIWGAQRRKVTPRRLDAPVISVGNLSMGGTGKTPMVVRLAELFKERGRKPGILTRGYGRESMDRYLTIAPHATVRTEHTGDEAQIFVRHGIAPVGIGGERYETGKLLRKNFDVDVLLLDDGFQHRGLARDVDIVLIDALDPFGAGSVFPLGRLREPPDGLARAGIIVITRADASDGVPAIEWAVRRWNAEAPIFRGSVEPRAWVAYQTGVRYAIDARPFGRAGAFCGLGNPASFHHTLRSAGVEAVGWVEFSDHHHYRPNELRRLSYQLHSLGAEALVTTEKDMVNLCDGAEELLAPLPLYWLEVGIAVEREDEFLAEIERRI